MTAAKEVISDLDRLGIEYEVMDCDPDLADTATFCEAYDVPLEKSANAILVASRKPEGHNVVCVVLAHTRLDVNGTVRKKLGVRKVSFAPPDLTKEITGQEIGGVTIFGLPDDLPAPGRRRSSSIQPGSTVWTATRSWKAWPKTERLESTWEELPRGAAESRAR